MLRDIDKITEFLQSRIPGVQISQLAIKHPADDDGLWFAKVRGRAEEVQIESASGNCPFLIESDFNDERHEGRSILEVIETVVKLFSYREGHRPTPQD
jgi:hypothetical protein